MKLSIITPTMKATYKVWLPFFVAMTLVTLTAYALVQQSVRMAADDPQVEFSEQLASQLKDIADPASFLSAQTPTDIRTSLETFAIAYGDDFKPVAATGKLDGQMPTIPQGVLERAKAKGENRVTWQPKSGVRIAAVVRSYENSGKTKYIVVGRSLREVESRETKLLEIAGVGWAASSLALFFVMGAPHYFANRRAQPQTAKRTAVRSARAKKTRRTKR